MELINRGFYKIRGPAKLFLHDCNAEIMGLSCQDCELVIPIGRTYLVRIYDECHYELTPGEALLEQDNLSPQFYDIRDAILNKLNNGYDSIVFLGASDTGKSTLASLTFNHIISRNENSGVVYVTSDIGQNELYMPGFITGTRNPVLPGAPSGNEFNCFVGAISPPMAIEKYLGCLIQIHKEIIRSGIELTVLDTDGWIRGERAINTKIAMLNLFDKPLIVVSSLDASFRSRLQYYYKDNLVEYGVFNLQEKTKTERSIHRNRLVAKVLKESIEVIIDPREVTIHGLKLFSGKELRPESLNIPGLLYAEDVDGAIIAVARSSTPKLKKPSITVLPYRWEKGLLLALYNHGEIVGVGLVKSIDYKRKKIRALINTKTDFDMVEIGTSRFAEVIDGIRVS